jgi:uncharacterized protein (TIGR00369 family)
MPDRVTELVAQDLPDDPPAGYAEIEPVGNFDLLMGRIYIRMDDEDAVMGFRVSPRHINAHGTCHGGMLASFADMLGYASRVQVDFREVSVPTVTLSCEYLRPVKLGDWVEGRAEVVKNGRNLIFSRFTGSVEGRIVFVANSVNIPGAQDSAGRQALDRALGPA